MRLLRNIVILSFLFITLKVAGQSGLTDTIFKIPEVEIINNRLEDFGTGIQIIKIDSTIIEDNKSAALADLLSRHSLISIKSYGPGGLSQMSIRGSGSNHTAVLWNGINLQSPNTGGVDVAQIPVCFMDDVKLQIGGAGALYGSGAIGGAIHLGNISEFDKGLKINLTRNYGSFETHCEGLNISISKKKWTSSIRTYKFYSENDFPYVNTTQFGSPEMRQSNSRLNQFGLMQENSVQLSKKQHISTHFWYQDNKNEIPPIMTDIQSSAYQNDSHIRSLITWKRIGNKVNLTAHSALINSLLYYHNPDNGLESIIHSNTFVNEVESKIKAGGFGEINIGLNDTYEMVTTENYAEDKARNRIAIFGSFSYHNKRDNLKTAINFREELIDNKFTMPCVSGGLSLLFLQNYKLLASISRNYRVPTFNELYWKIWGNPDLVPESGWNQDVSLNYNKKIKTLSFDIKISGFNSYINQWIIWLPKDTLINNVLSSIWRPENIKKVWARGLEASIRTTYKQKNISISLSGLYSYTKSTNMESEASSNEIVGKQLIYIPVHKANANISIDLKGYYLSYTHRFTSTRYSTQDNSERWSIAPYNLANLVIGKNFHFSNTNISIKFHVNNIWNSVYQVMIFYAMPQRNYQIGFSFNFNKPNKLIIY